MAYKFERDSLVPMPIGAPYNPNKNTGTKPKAPTINIKPFTSGINNILNGVNKYSQSSINSARTPDVSNLGRGQGTAYNSSQYRNALNRQSLDSLESQRRDLGTGIFTNAKSIYNAPFSSDVDQPTKPSMTGKTKEQYENAMGVYDTALASSDAIKQQEQSVKEERRKKNKSQYENAIGSIEESILAAPQYVYNNVLDVFEPWDEEGNPRSVGPHLSNIAWTQRLVDEEEGKELADEYNKDVDKTKLSGSGSASDDASGELDVTSTVVDPDTGEEIALTDLTLAGAELADDDYAGIAAAQYLYSHPELYAKYGDDWSKFQREGTYDEWKAVLNDITMQQYFTDLLNDEAFQTDGEFDMDKYWEYALGLDMVDPEALSDRDFAYVFGNSAGVNNAINQYRAEMSMAHPDMYGLKVNPNYGDEYSDFITNNQDSFYTDNSGNYYYGGFGDTGLTEDQLVSLYNMQTLSDAAMTYQNPEAYSLGELNMLSRGAGWDTTYADEALNGYSNDFGVGDNFSFTDYNPYETDMRQIAAMVNGEAPVYDPAGYIMDYYMPADLYYMRA